jgi:hypothetical protein
MAQGRVTDYFSTRKRTRFNQDEMVVLNKQKKTHKLLESNTGIETFDEIKILKSKLSMINTLKPASPEKRCLRSNVKIQGESNQTIDKIETQ